MSEIIRDYKGEIHYDYGKFTAKQNKSKDGQRILDKIYCYSKEEGSYYKTTAFATFSSKWNLDNFIAIITKEEKS